MKHSIHDLDDQRATKILSNCHRAVKPNGKVVVVDREIRAPNAPDPKKFFDVAMMLMPRGRERSEPEWNTLFAASGLRATRIIATPGPRSVIECKPV